MKRRDFVKLVGVTSLGVTFPITLKADGFPDYTYAPQEGILSVIDISEGFKYFLNKETVEIYDNLKNSQNLVLITEEGLKVTQFFGVRTNNIKAGCAKLAELYTKFHKENKSIAKLAPPMAVPLIDGSFSCIMYVTFDKELNKENEYVFAEGQAPIDMPGEKLDDLSKYSYVTTYKQDPREVAVKAVLTGDSSVYVEKEYK